MSIQNYIDHTALKPTTQPDDIKMLCKEAKIHQFYAVCVNGCYTALAKSELEGTEVKVASVIGFPLGAMSTAAKMDEASQNVKDGADEIDMVINIGWLKAGLYNEVESDIAAVKMAIGNKILKVIIETCYLTEEEKVKACEISLKAHADFVKTSTGFGPKGATLEDVKLMKKVVGDKLKVKASGGIKTLAQAEAYIMAGADRIGTSSGVAIVNQD